MAIQFLVTHSDKYIKTESVQDSEGNDIVSQWQMYECEFDSTGVNAWNGDIPLNEPLLTSNSEIIQRLIDVYDVALIGKTIVIDLENPDGNIVRLI